MRHLRLEKNKIKGCFFFSMRWRLQASSVTRLGDFLKFLVTNFLTKVAQIFGDYLGYFEKSKEKKLL